MIDAIANILSADVFRGGALLTTALTGVGAIIMLLVRQRPELARIEDESRNALDASTQAELKRLGERLDQADKRNRECEELHSKDRRRIEELEEEVVGLRRQLVQFQESQVRVLAEQGAIPRDMLSTLKVIK